MDMQTHSFLILTLQYWTSSKSAHVLDRAASSLDTVSAYRRFMLANNSPVTLRFCSVSKSLQLSAQSRKLAA